MSPIDTEVQIHMRFLVTTMAQHPIPPQMALPLFEGLSSWAAAQKAAGKLEQVWSFAGLQGGGGIATVDSLEELDELLTTFPLAPFSKTDIFPLVDLEPSLERVRSSIRAMMPPQS